MTGRQAHHRIPQEARGRGRTALRRTAFATLAAAGGLWFLASLLAQSLAQPAEPVRQAIVLEARGVISPPLADYIAGEIEAAQGTASLVILEMDTPGGLVTSMQAIVRAILASDVPVATYVSPSGASALSAGTYIAYASHVAAMAPGTNIGAATPVQLSGSEPTPIPEPVETPETDGAEPADESAPPAEESPASAPGTALELKSVNAYVAYIRSLAELHGRNADWAEEAVREAVSASANEALELGAIDVVARDIPDLIAQIDGRQVQMHEGPRTLDVKGAVPVRSEQPLLVRLLLILADPNIALLLMNIGAIGILMEVYNPGSIFPGTVGVICLILGLYALSVLPTNYAGAALFFLGALFLAAEFFIASGGILGVSGLIAMGLGALFLFDTDIPELRVSLPLLGGLLVGTGAVVFFLGTYAAALRAKPPETGLRSLVGTRARVTRWSGKTGYIHADGENWQARSETSFAVGDEVIIQGFDGLVAIVTPVGGKS